MKLDFESNTMTFASVGSDISEAAETENNNSAEVSQMLRQGIEAAQSGKSAEARNLLLRVTEAEPGNEKAWLWLASISEYPEELLVFLNNVLKINPENERALEWAKATKSLLSKTFVQRGIDAANEPGDFAKQCFLQAIGHDEKNEMAWLWLASVSVSEEEKATNLEKVLSINPENETAKKLLGSMQKNICDAMFQKALSFAVEGENEKALDALEEYFAASSEKEDALVMKAFLAGSFAEKLECFDAILEVNSENELAQRNAAYLRTMMQKPQAETVQTQIFEVEEKAEVFAPEAFEEAKEEVFAVAESEEFAVPEESHFAEEVPLPEPDILQLDAMQTEDFSTEDEAETEAEHAEMENRFEEPQAEFAAPEEAQVEEMPVLQNESNAVENFEFPVNYSDEQKAEEKEHSFTETEEKAEDFAAPQSLYSDATGAFADYNNETETYEGIQELMSNYGFEQPSAQTEYTNGEVREAVEENEVSDVYEMESSETVAENNYSHLFEAAKEPQEVLPETMLNFDANEVAPESSETEHQNAQHSFETHAEMVACGFCDAANEAHSLVCFSCRAVLTLSDLEMILANQEADKEVIGNALSRMEEERENREMNADELKQIALGYLNMGNLPKGLSYLNESAKMIPDDFLLSGQINSLKIRQAEIEKQNAVHDLMPKNLTILVVDDSATVRKLISGKLEKSGHAVVCAMDGIEALEKIKDLVPDLVLLDINMPRMDGYQVCKMIRSNDATKDVPVVMISGKDGFFDKVRGRMAGTTGYITKPFGPETLMKTVETYIV